ncbi:MAG: tetratricopeptide repeat protein [Gemmataceae bacterium]
MTDPTELFNAAVVRHRAGDTASAEAMYKQVLTVLPGHAESLSNLGAINSRAGHYAEAERYYREALMHRPDFAECMVNLATALMRQNRIDESAAALRNALRATDPPADTRSRLWRLLFAAGRDADAVYDLAEHLEKNPTDAHARHLYGVALGRLGRVQEAVEQFRQAAADRPGFADANNALGVTLELIGQPDAALAEFRAALAAKPDHADATANLAIALTEQGRAAEAVPLFRKLLAGPIMPPVHSNYLLALNYLPDVPPAEVFAEHRRWAERHADKLMPAALPKANPGKKLHIGYVSADLRGHPVAAYFEAVLGAHDRGIVRVSCFSGTRKPDATTERLKAKADGWHDISNMDDVTAADLIRREGIDVLVDLGGHTAGNRLLVFACKPAPVQVTHFGYPNTTGMRAMDYRLTDAIADPPGSEAFYSEKLVRLPEVAWVYRPPADAPAVSPLPAETTGHFTFAALNNPAKLTEAAVKLWSRVLESVPNSRLMILGGHTEEGRRWVENLFRRQKVHERVEVLARRAAAEYFALFHQADLALDPFPYNGGVTTCDALWMGVPVVSLVGQTYAARQGAMALKAVGLPGLAAATPDDFVRVATNWSKDLGWLRTTRLSLRERMRTSPLGDAIRFTRHLELAYKKMVQEKKG